MAQNNKIRYCKEIFKDEDGRWFRIDTQKALLARVKRGMPSTKLMADLSGMVSESVMQRFFKLCEGGGADGTRVKVDMVKGARAAGLALCEDEKAFIREITPIIETAMEERGDMVGIRGVYDMLNRILYEMLCSQFYNFVPDNQEEDGYEYYEKRIQEVKMMLQREFLGEQEIKEKLRNITNEVSGFVKSYSVPSGAAKRWFEINPKLHFYDPAYDIYEENPELYAEIAMGDIVMQDGVSVSFNVELSEESAAERRAYFAEIERNCELFHEEFDEERAFQEEMIKTLEMVFERDFEMEDIKYV